MMRFGLGFLACMGLFAYFAGIFSPGGYSREVSRPQAQVMAALEDLDITAQPGAPGSAQQNGVKPIFRLEKAVDHMTWYVMSGDQVAVAMTAKFEPVDDGRKTRVRASVERGDAPDDFVSPAFRSTGIIMGLFGMALEDELNKLTMTASYDPERCQRLLDQFTDSNYEARMADQPQSLGAAIGQTSKTVIRLHAMEAELRRNGCPTNGNSGPFRPTQNTMGSAAASSSSPSSEPGPPSLGHAPEPTTQLDDGSGY